MKNLFNKIVNLGQSLSELTNDDLRENGIESIMIFAWSTEFEKVALSKGRLEYVMAMIGQTLSRISKESGIPLMDLIHGIYDCETALEQHEEGGDYNDLY